MENKHISYRQSARIYEFFIVFQYCAIEEILNTAYLPLQFSIILQLLTSSIYSEKMTLVLWEINTYHTDKVSVQVSLFILFGYCGTEKILNAAYLPLGFSIILQPMKFSIEWYITNGVLFHSDRKVSHENGNISMFPQKNTGKPQGKISIFAITQEGPVQSGSSSNSTETLMRLNCVENFITI